MWEGGKQDSRHNRVSTKSKWRSKTSEHGNNRLELSSSNVRKGSSHLIFLLRHSKKLRFLMPEPSEIKQHFIWKIFLSSHNANSADTSNLTPKPVLHSNSLIEWSDHELPLWSQTISFTYTPGQTCRVVLVDRVQWVWVKIRSNWLKAQYSNPHTSHETSVATSIIRIPTIWFRGFSISADQSPLTTHWHRLQSQSISIDLSYSNPNLFDTVSKP